MKKILPVLVASLLLSLYGCTPPTPNREYVTETAPVRDSDDTYVETTEQQRLEGTVQAVCGEDLIRIKLYNDDAKQWGDTVYVRITTKETLENWCSGDEVWVTYDTVELSHNPQDLPVIVATSIELLILAAKPVIYLYPEAPTICSVKLTLNGALTCTYPDYEAGWNGFTAYPDGTLLFPDGKEYYCLYWEGCQVNDWDFSKGFCVKGSDTAAFLEWALSEQGLTPREANEFIIYWLPLMEDNPYNVISFQSKAYTDGAALEISPAPDSLLRIFMAYYPSEKAVDIPHQELEGFARNGFTAVEWGGSQTRRPD